MESVLVKCTMCGTHDMVRAPHRGGNINSGPIYMICPYCDTDTGEVVLNEKGLTDGVARDMPPGSRQYDGVGPTQHRDV